MKTSFFKHLLRAATGQKIVRSLLGHLLKKKAAIFMLHRAERPDIHQTGHPIDLIRKILRWVTNNNIKVISLQEMIQSLASKKQLNEFSIAFTLDDGFADQGDLILPVFLEYKVPATVFLLTDFTDGKSWPWDYKIKFAILNSKQDRISVNLGRGYESFVLSSIENRRLMYRRILGVAKSYDSKSMGALIRDIQDATGVDIPTFPPSEYCPLTWNMARRFEEEGIRFGPHGKSHRAIASLNREEAHSELRDSWNRLTTELKNPLPVFCWPMGGASDFTSENKILVRELGMMAAVSAVPGYIEQSEHDRYALPRYSLPDDMSQFTQIVTGVARLRGQ